MTRDEDQSDSAVQIPQAANDEFVQLFTKWQRRLFLFILAQVPNLVEAEEILQETNLVIWRKSHTFRPGDELLRLVLPDRRAGSLQAPRPPPPPGHPDERRLLEAIAREAQENVDSLEERRRALLACLARLAASDRELIRRRYAPGETGKSLARKLGRPANSVYQSLSRIRRTLLECVKRRLAAEAQT